MCCPFSPNDAVHKIYIKQQHGAIFAHLSCKMEVSPSSNNLSSDKMKSFQQSGIFPSSPLALMYILLILLFQHRKCFSVSGGNTLSRRSNPSPVLAFVPWWFVQYEPGPMRHVSTLTQRHTGRKKKPHPSSSIPLSPALTPHLSSKVRLFISLPHPIKPTLYKRMKVSLPSCCWRIRAEVETVVSDDARPYRSPSRCTNNKRGISQSPSADGQMVELPCVSHTVCSNTAAISIHGHISYYLQW